MASKISNFVVNIDPKEVMYTSINTNKDNYNYASIVIQKGENEYMNISYEWRSGGIPGFAMDLMSFMKTNNVETSGVWEGKEKCYEEFSKMVDK